MAVFSCDKDFFLATDRSSTGEEVLWHSREKE
jgi:hypothetical protein